MRTRRAILGLLPAAAFLAPWAGARAAEPAKAGTRPVLLFNIPAQPLQQALVAYATVVENQIIYDSKLARGQRSSPVMGLLTGEAALRTMLQGTDLTVVSTGGQDVILASIAELAAARQTAAKSAGAGGGDAETTLVLETLHVDMPAQAKERPEYSSYAQQVRAEIRRALTSSPQTAGRRYDLRLELVIDAKGALGRPKLVRSTGKGDLDRAILRIIGSLSLGLPPPEGMPQPIRIAILAI